MTSIGANAFSGRVKLSSVPLYEKLQEIGAGAYKNCSALQEITICVKVNSIGKNAFNGCANLLKVILKTKKLTADNVGAGAFKGNPKKAVYTCPKGKKESYKEILTKKGASKKATYQ